MQLATIETPTLAIGCELSGPEDGRPVIYFMAGLMISVPTLVIHGGGDPCNDPLTSDGKENSFASDYQRIVLDGVGHFPQREAPEAVSKATIRFPTNRDK